MIVCANSNWLCWRALRPPMSQPKAGRNRSGSRTVMASSCRWKSRTLVARCAVDCRAWTSSDPVTPMIATVDSTADAAP
ncbi:hypothetical protein D5S17_16635 [Pseudonocardiaceae bacterium YIM PH 21723]|nr:hypothetical protein D5S17_16635 [Pseudonocardiaceae bacterium YIM PH 21723]